MDSFTLRTHQVSIQRKEPSEKRLFFQSRWVKLNETFRIRADTSKPGTRITRTWADRSQTASSPDAGVDNAGSRTTTNIMLSRVRWAWNRETTHPYCFAVQPVRVCSSREDFRSPAIHVQVVSGDSDRRRGQRTARTRKAADEAENREFLVGPVEWFRFPRQSPGAYARTCSSSNPPHSAEFAAVRVRAVAGLLTAAWPTNRSDAARREESGGLKSGGLK
jgi:hypothetical protein